MTRRALGPRSWELPWARSDWYAQSLISKPSGLVDTKRVAKGGKLRGPRKREIGSAPMVGQTLKNEVYAYKRLCREGRDPTPRALAIGSNISMTPCPKLIRVPFGIAVGRSMPSQPPHGVARWPYQAVAAAKQLGDHLCYVQSRRGRRLSRQGRTSIYILLHVSVNLY
jgi:hypothetical protein